MRVAILIARVLMGLLLLVFGLNGFFHFIPGSDAVPPGPMGVFTEALASGHITPVVSFFQALIGVLLLAGRFVPLALVMLVPILVGIVLFHLSFDPASGVPGVLLCVLTAFLMWAYRAHLLPLLRVRTEPAV